MTIKLGDEIAKIFSRLITNNDGQNKQEDI